MIIDYDTKKLLLLLLLLLLPWFCRHIRDPYIRHSLFDIFILQDSLIVLKLDSLRGMGVELPRS